MLLLLAGCKKDQTVTPQQVPPVVVVPPPPVKVKTFTVSNVVQSGMVVQRDKPLAIWGTATIGIKVMVSVSWNDAVYSVISDSSGNWKVKIAAAAANNTPQSITVKVDSLHTKTFDNILIGDVWLCSGQSNMAYPMDAIAPFRGVLNYPSEIASANYPAIRMLTVPYDSEQAPLTDLPSPAIWQTCSQSTIRAISGVAYYFARKLNTTLNVPVGIVISADNGSYCQQWTNSEAIAGSSQLFQYEYGSSGLYNGMISPLTNMTIKGFLWYQGENNERDNPVSNYTTLNSAMITGWRSKFNDLKLPFYLVQLAPFADDYATTIPESGNPTLDFLAMFREAQSNILALPGTDMAITMDVGEPDNHHPQDKRSVGERLCLLALKDTYKQNVICHGPRFQSVTINGPVATIKFLPGTAASLTTSNGEPLKQYFFVAGFDHVFYRATAQIQGSAIVITAPATVSLPIQSVRYAFTNAPATNIQNSSGLPVEPFRTDSWSN